MKILNGAELAGFIKERQAKQVRALRQAHNVAPSLAIVRTSNNSVINTYIRLKQEYGDDILVSVQDHLVTHADIKEIITQLNNDSAVHGVIVQLPLENPEETDAILSMVDPSKDIDGLGLNAEWDPATPTAINWLLAGYGIEITGHKILIIGKGRLVGAPLAKIWQASGYDVTAVDQNNDDITAIAKKSNIIVSATGVPSLLTGAMVSPDTIVIDAGTTDEGGVIKGDIADDLRERHDITITPIRGGVGPLTVAALFDNVIRAARKSI